MVNGVDIFKAFFRDFTDNYILIGGAACDEHLVRAGLTFRATRDLDIILVVEALNSDFVIKFWEFLKEGKYKNRQKSTGERKYYRFFKPENKAFPDQLELFARKPDVLDLANDTQLAPIPTDEDLSSLSAVLMDDDYYYFTRENSKVEDNLHFADTAALVCLKAKAFLDLSERKIKGEIIDERNIRKHKNDIVRLAVLLTGENSQKLPDSIVPDMQNFIKLLDSETPDYRAIGKSMGIPALNGKEILDQIMHAFSL
jgi:hypothetical protein